MSRLEAQERQLINHMELVLAQAKRKHPEDPAAQQSYMSREHKRYVESHYGKGVI